jgi:hypothetical protein
MRELLKGFGYRLPKRVLPCRSVPAAESGCAIFFIAQLPLHHVTLMLMRTNTTTTDHTPIHHDHQLRA